MYWFSMLSSDTTALGVVSRRLRVEPEPSELCAAGGCRDKVEGCGERRRGRGVGRAFGRGSWVVSLAGVVNMVAIVAYLLHDK